MMLFKYHSVTATVVAAMSIISSVSALATIYTLNTQSHCQPTMSQIQWDILQVDGANAGHPPMGDSGLPVLTFTFIPTQPGLPSLDLAAMASGFQPKGMAVGNTITLQTVDDGPKAGFQINNLGCTVGANTFNGYVMTASGIVQDPNNPGTMVPVTVMGDFVNAVGGVASSATTATTTAQVSTSAVIPVPTNPTAKLATIYKLNTQSHCQPTMSQIQWDILQVNGPNAGHPPMGDSGLPIITFIFTPNSPTAVPLNLTNMASGFQPNGIAKDNMIILQTVDDGPKAGFQINGIGCDTNTNTFIGYTMTAVAAVADPMNAANVFPVTIMGDFVSNIGVVPPPTSAVVAPPPTTTTMVVMPPPPATTTAASFVGGQVTVTSTVTSTILVTVTANNNGQTAPTIITAPTTTTTAATTAPTTTAATDNNGGNNLTGGTAAPASSIAQTIKTQVQQATCVNGQTQLNLLLQISQTDTLSPQNPHQPMAEFGLPLLTATILNNGAAVGTFTVQEQDDGPNVQMNQVLTNIPCQPNQASTQGYTFGYSAASVTINGQAFAVNLTPSSAGMPTAVVTPPAATSTASAVAPSPTSTTSTTSAGATTSAAATGGAAANTINQTIKTQIQSTQCNNGLTTLSMMLQISQTDTLSKQNPHQPMMETGLPLLMTTVMNNGAAVGMFTVQEKDDGPNVQQTLATMVPCQQNVQVNTAGFTFAYAANPVTIGAQTFNVVVTAA